MLVLVTFNYIYKITEKRLNGFSFLKHPFHIVDWEYKTYMYAYKKIYTYTIDLFCCVSNLVFHSFSWLIWN